MRQWMKLIEARHYVGNCVNSFNADGECVIPDLPWRTTSDLAYADENALELKKKTFFAGATVPDEILEKISGHDVFYLDHNSTYMLYDSDDDIHYFFI